MTERSTTRRPTKAPAEPAADGLQIALITSVELGRRQPGAHGRGTDTGGRRRIDGRAAGSVLICALVAAVALWYSNAWTRPAPAGSQLQVAATDNETNENPGAAGIPESVTGRMWFAEVDLEVWVAGSIGGRTLELPPGEVAIAAADGWVVSTSRATKMPNLSWRRLDGTSATLGVDLIPASVAISGDLAFISGFDGGSGGDPGVFELDLISGEMKRILEPGKTNGPRSVAISGSGRQLVSAVCSSEENGCDLDVLDLPKGTVTHVGRVPGYLRTVGETVAVIGSDPATWIAGIDLSTGKELWRRDMSEVWSGYVTSSGILVQAYLTYAADGPIFGIDTIDIVDGSTSNVLSAAADGAVGLWPEVSSDDTVVVGPGYSIEDALANNRDSGPVTADMYDLDGTRRTSGLPIGGD